MDTATAADDPMAGVIRGMITGLPDETIRGIVEGVVKGLAQGVVEVLTDRIVEHLADLGAEETPLVVVESVTAAPAMQLHVPESTRTCELCGRVGSRRFERTPTGWRCSPTAKCDGRHPQPTPKPKTTPEPPPVELEPPAAPKPMPAGVTARCQDCTRTWTLTGRVLQQAIDIHEFKHSHIVEKAK